MEIITKILSLRLPMISITTRRLSLHPLIETDLEAFSLFRSNPDVARYQSWSTPYTLDQARLLLAEMPETLVGNPGRWYSLAIERQAEPGIIGEFAIQLLAEDERQAQFGFTIDARFQRQGYASEALSGVLDYLFGVLRLHRVSAICDVENLASKAVLEKIGMRREAELIENVWFKGAWGSEYAYAILEREWAVAAARHTSLG
jgi:ribosomal-protein-alanine N-acetyltransferase